MRFLPMVELQEEMFGVRLDLLTCEDAVTRLLVKCQESIDGAYVCLTNVHLLAEADADSNVRAALNGAYLNLPDGMPVVWQARRRGHGLQSNVRGVDLMQALCVAGVSTNMRHVFYGGTPEVLIRLQAWFTQACPGIIISDTISPPFGPLSEAEQSELIDRINGAEPDVVWVCLGAPRQELWMAEHAERLEARVLLGVGVAFEFLAGTRSQAPAWMRRQGLEWLYRLAHEPGRLSGRYLRTNSRFLWMLLRDFLHRGGNA